MRSIVQPGVLELFARQVVAYPDAVAIVHRQRRATYRELDDWSNRLAHWLVERGGVGKGMLVPFCLGRGLDQIALMLAIVKTGAAYVPLDRHAPPARNRHILSELDASVLIADASTQRDLAELQTGNRGLVQVLDLDEERSQARAASAAQLGIVVGPDDVLHILYTSGSTGRPKGSLIPSRGVVRLVHETNYMTVTPADVFTQMASISFDAATFEIWGALLNGARLVLVDTDVVVDPRSLRQLLEQEQVTVVLMTTGLFNQHVSADPAMFGGLRYLMFGGEAAAVETVRRLCRSGRRPQYLYNAYGPTENTTYSTVHLIEELPAPGVAIPIGTGISGTTCYVVDPEMRLVAAGGAGELLVGGAGVALGYLHQPELTQQKFILNPFMPGDTLYRTGDMVRLRDDGALVFVGRIDNQVKIRGFRIEIEEVELALGTYPGLAEVAVLAEDDTTQTKRLAAYLRIANGDATPALANLRAHLKDHLPPYMIPSVFRRVDSFPLGVTGKIDRRALANLPAETLVSEAETLAPRDELETEVRDVWARHLGVAPASVGVETGFFALGGQSLLAAAIVTEMAGRRGIELRLSDLFEAPTVAAFARKVAQAPRRELARISSVARTHDLPLSWSQEQIWLHQQITPEAPYYNEPLDITIPEQLDFTAFQRALCILVERHESMRLRVELRSGRPGQRIEPLGALQLPFVDLRHLSTARRRTEARRLATEQALRPFDLAYEPPVRFTLIRLENELYRLYLAGHHVALDGVSMFQVFLPELESVYRALARSETPELPPLPFAWRDWLVWQRESEMRPEWTAQLGYWGRQLADLHPLELPTDRTRGAHERFDGARITLELGQHLTGNLKELARGQSTSLFSVLLAAFQILLYRYTHQNDIAVGSVVGGRDLAGLDRHVCDTLNTILLRTRIADGASFVDVLAAARQTCVEAFSNQDVPFQLVAQRFQLDPSRERSVPIQVVFVLEPPSPTNVAGWSINQLEIHTRTAKFDLTMELDDRGDCIIGRVEYRTELFDEETIQRLIIHYRTLLEGAVAAPSTPVARLPLMDDDERRRVLVDWNDTTVEYDSHTTLHELVAAQEARQPDAPAILQGSRSISFGELGRGARTVASRLMAAGVRPGDLVAVWTDRIPQHVVGQLGVLMTGSAYVPLGADEPVERAKMILNDGGVRAVLVDRVRREHLQGFQTPAILLEDLDYEPAGLALPATHPDAAAYVIFTSGSTGRPKGAIVSHRAIVDRALWARAQGQIGPGDVGIHLTSLSFDCALIPTWWLLCNGGAAVIPTSDEMRDPTLVAQVFLRHGVTHSCATPAFWNFLALCLEKEGVRHRWACTAGERLTRDLWQRLLKIADRVINGYGPTECAVLSTIWESETLERENPPIGGPIANTTHYVLDPRGEPVPIGVRGELFIGGTGVGSGYLNLPDRTKASFLPNPFGEGIVYRTGDIVRWLPNGELDYLGRADHQVKIRGFRIELGEIESCLLAHAGIKSCIVVVREDAGGKRLVAYLVGDAAADIRGYLREKLPPPMVPSTIMFLERLPLSPNGKIDRKALPDPGCTDEPREQSDAPLSTLERRLLEHFRAVVRSPHFKLKDDFFESGGDSLGAMELAAKASADGLPVTVRDIIRHRTVRAVAEALGRVEAAQRFAENPPEYLTHAVDVETKPVREIDTAPAELRAASALLPFREDGDLPPLFFVHPAGGSAVSYRHLAEYLPNQPFYGLECVEGYTGKSVESMAREYLAEVRQVQPKGPYFLGGWSFGGNVAFEMARQLEAEPAENRAAIVILIDSRPLTHPTQHRFISEMTSNSAAIRCLIGRHFAQMTGRPEPISYQALCAVPDAARNERFLEAVDKAEMFPRHLAGEFVRRFIEDFDVCMHMLADYRLAGRRRTDLLLLRASEVSTHYEGFPAMEEPLQHTADPTYGWGELTSGRVTVRTSPGTHETCVFPPNVSSVASHIRAEIGRRVGVARHFDALPSLTAAQWSKVLDHTECHTVIAGGLLIEDGATDRRVYLVASGLLEVLAAGRRIAEAGGGTVLGEVAFIDGRPRTASVRALSEVMAFSLTPASFEQLAGVAPEIALVIMGDLARIVAQRFRSGQEKMLARRAAG